MPPEAQDPAADALVRLSAALGTRDLARIRAAMAAAAEAARPEAVEEVILQAHLFVGFPDALNALSLWREVSGLPAPPPLDDDPAGWEARGERVCARVYGGSYRRLRENVRALHPDVDGWMVAGGYGRVIGRPGLDLVTRELCIAALLAVWRVPRQLHSHLRGALNAGASVARVDAAVDAACDFLDAAGAAEARRLWGEIRARAA
jgi:4-carboxymuconolactone decarboxylase